MNKLYLVLSFLLMLGGRQAAQAQVSPGCNAAFQATVSGNTVFFRAMDSLPGVQHSWNFGDGSISSSTDSFMTSHFYGSPGTYVIIQTVADTAHHCQDTASQQVTIAQPPPSCVVLVTETSDSVHHLYTFVANTYFSQPTADTIRWTINDTLAGQGDTLTRYLPGGPYTVCATMSTSFGCQAQSCLTVNPQDSIPTPPPPPQDTCTISFTAEPKKNNPNEYVFTVVDHQDYDSISWTIVGADSLFAGPFHGPGFSYTFADTGYYDVYVSAEKKAGCAVFNGQAIHIDSLPAPRGQTINSYPNPATTQATLNVTLNTNSSITVQVYNSMGILVLTQSVSGYPGNNAITLPIANLPQGVYYVQVQYGGTTVKSKIQKL